MYMYIGAFKWHESPKYEGWPYMSFGFPEGNLTFWVKPEEDYQRTLFKINRVLEWLNPVKTGLIELPPEYFDNIQGIKKKGLSYEIEGQKEIRQVYTIYTNIYFKCSFRLQFNVEDGKEHLIIPEIIARFLGLLDQPE